MTNAKFGTPGKRTYQKRTVKVEDSITLQKRILIVCEGEKTEPKYFERFRMNRTIRELDIRGEGMNTLSLVKETERIVEKDGSFDEVWCVFDRDSFKPDTYDNAISKINSKPNWHVAYSNEAFELWFVLHFEYLDTAVDRSHYRDRLTHHRGEKYEKNDETFYDFLESNGNETRAMSHAKRLVSEQDVSLPLSRQCPSTTVHIFVQELRKWEKEAEK